MDGFKNGIAMNGSEFQGRALRIKKAVPAERLKKKITNAEKRIHSKKKILEKKQRKQRTTSLGGTTMKTFKTFACKDVDAVLFNLIFDFYFYQ